MTTFLSLLDVCYRFANITFQYEAQTRLLLNINFNNLKATAMYAKKRKILLLILALVLVSVKQSFAESSSDYAAMGKAAWSAFECSALAEKSKNPKEQERLFKYGYAQGLKFIEAIQAEKVKGEDLSKGVPIMMLLLLQGPTPDFMLGRVFEGALDSALEDVYKTSEKFNSDEMQETIAKNKFWKQNCQLIGK